MLNDSEMKHIIGVLFNHVMPTQNNQLDKQATTKLIIKLMGSSHRDIVINHLQQFSRKETP